MSNHDVQATSWVFRHLDPIGTKKTGLVSKRAEGGLEAVLSRCACVLIHQFVSFLSLDGNVKTLRQQGRRCKLTGAKDLTGWRIDQVSANRPLFRANEGAQPGELLI